MINLSYRFDQDSTSLELFGIPDVSNGDSENTIGILTSWSLKIIGSPLLEGEKEHLDYLMQVILQYSRSYISGIRKTFISENEVVKISPFGNFHKLYLKSTRKDVKPLEISIDDSELSDLTRCLDLLRFDPRFNLSWNIKSDAPFNKRYILSSLVSPKRHYNFFYSLFIFLSTSALLLLIPTNNKYEFTEQSINSNVLNDQSK